MASDPKRRELRELMKELYEHTCSFIRIFDNKQTRMTGIKSRLEAIADELKGMHETTDEVRKGGVIGGAAGLGIFALGLIAAPFTGGASLAAAAAVGGVVGGAAGAVAGGAAVVGANVKKSFKEGDSAEEIEKLEREFLEIVKPLRDELENIRKTCEKLEEKSKEVQADLKAFIKKVSELRSQSGKVVTEADSLMEKIQNLINSRVFTVTGTPERDKELRDYISESSRLFSKVTKQFEEMKKELEKVRLMKVKTF